MIPLGNTLTTLPVTHYHRVDDATYHAVMDFLRDVLLRSVERASGRYSCRLSPFMLTQILYFIDQMETAYLHPRATSRRWSMHCQSLTEKKPK